MRFIPSSALYILTALTAAALLLFTLLANVDNAGAQTPLGGGTATSDVIPTPHLPAPDDVILGPAPQISTLSRENNQTTEKVLAALIDFPDVSDSERRFTKQDISALLNDNPDSLKRFINETSRRQVNVEFDVLDWVTLDKTRNQYSPPAYTAIRDAVSKLSSRVDLSQYDKVVLFMVPVELGYPGCVAYLAPVSYNTPAGRFRLGTAVLSGYDMGCVEKGRIAHEFGHTYGLVHSYSISGCHKSPPVPRSLIDPTDMNDSCYESNYCANPDCTELFTDDAGIVANQDFDMLGGDHTERYEGFFPVHFHAAWQALAGWLTESQVLEARQNGQYTLTTLEALTTNPKAIKIPIGADHRGEPQYYWLETRKEITRACQVDMRLQASQITSYFEETPSWSGPPWNTYNFGWSVLPNKPFWDPHRGIRIEMLNCTQGTAEETVRLRVSFTQLSVDKPVVALFNGAEASVNLTNSSNSRVNIGSASIGGRHSPNFVINSDNCSNRALEPAASCRIIVWHISENPGSDNSAKHGVLKIPNSDALAPDMAISLFGNRPRQGQVTPVTPTPTRTLTPTATSISSTNDPTPTPTSTSGASEPTPTTVPVSTAGCANGISVDDPANEPYLVQACATLLKAAPILAAQPPLNWSIHTPMNTYNSTWEGLGLGGPRPVRVVSLDLMSRNLTGRIPSALGDLPHLEHWLWLSDNSLTGNIPSALGNLSKLERLYLTGNQLTGNIPPQLGNLSNLKVLHLGGNRLTGNIPPELGNLSKLEALYISGNRLSGCIPTSLRDVEYNDFWKTGLQFCDEYQPPTPTFTPTPTPSATPIGDEAVRARMAGLEEGMETTQAQMGTLQSLLNSMLQAIIALTNKIAALDGGPQAPTFTPTPTPTHTPTPTQAPGSTPVPTATPTLTPIPTLAAACIGKIGLGWLTGTWNADCLSDKTPPTAKAGTRYARFYTFTLDAPATVTVSIASTDVSHTYLYLLDGVGNEGAVVNRDDTRISEQLPTGAYTIEATTYNLQTGGNFTLMMDISR